MWFAPLLQGGRLGLPLLERLATGYGTDEWRGTPLQQGLRHQRLHRNVDTSRDRLQLTQVERPLVG